MKQYQLGVLGASNIAYKRFLPALLKSEDFSFAGIASRSVDKCRPYIDSFGGKAYESYDELLNDPAIDCVYVPLPPALHAFWGEKVLNAGKHLLLEKPFTTSVEETERLLALAESKNLAVYENYAFLYHSQLAEIKKLVEEGRIGELHAIRTAFTFPFRGANDFRYNKALGGGALLDCGGYPMLLSAELLGPGAEIAWSSLRCSEEFDLDIGGSVVLRNGEGLSSQVLFGMDDSYSCELELCGSKGRLYTNRIFTAPPDFVPTVELNVEGVKTTLRLEPDDQFLRSIEAFAVQIREPSARAALLRRILEQSRRLDTVRDRK